MLFDILKYIHVVLAIVAVGANATYAIWIQRGTIDGEALPFTLRGIRLIDNRVANPDTSSCCLPVWPWYLPANMSC